MIIKPKIRGFICTTTHPVGCQVNVNKQIEYIRKNGKLTDGPARVLVIGASTVGVFFEKPGTDAKPGSAGWYNSAAFDEAAKREGLYSKSINGDAFSDECRDEVISLIKEDLGQIDLVVYSLASPVRKMPKTGEIVRSALKPIGEVYTSKAIDTNKDQIITASIEPATEEEVRNTVTVMGGEDWELWIDALNNAGVLADGVKTVAYSYIGTDLTWPIYWHGALGKAKEDLDRVAKELRNKLAPLNGAANVAVLKSVVTQASSAIPVMPLYISIVFKLMKDRGIHEGCIEQINRLMTTSLYGGNAKLDDEQRIRMDDLELREDVQQACREIWPTITDENLEQLTDYIASNRITLGFLRCIVHYFLFHRTAYRFISLRFSCNHINRSFTDKPDLFKFKIELHCVFRFIIVGDAGENNILVHFMFCH